MKNSPNIFVQKLSSIEDRLQVLIKKVNQKNYFNDDEAVVDNAMLLDIMNITDATAKNWRKDGLIAYSTINRRYYYKVGDIKEMIRRNYKPAKKK